MEITVNIKSVYGEEKVYPVCDNAKRFAAIAGTKTLTQEALKHISAMGITIKLASVGSIRLIA